MMPQIQSIDYQLYVQRETEFSHSPYKHELELYELIKHGEKKKIEENKARYPNTPAAETGQGKLSENLIRNEQYHMIINTAIITRVCIAEGLSEETAYTLSDMYIREADKCTQTYQVHELNDKMVLDFTEQMAQLRKNIIYSPSVRAAINYIYDNLHIKISASAVAERLGYNRSYFSVLFKKETGMTIGEFIMKKRINTAANMLKATDFPYSNIALALGFSSQSHFCKCFKESCGISPKAYRQKFSNIYF